MKQVSRIFWEVVTMEQSVKNIKWFTKWWVKLKDLIKNDRVNEKWVKTVNDMIKEVPNTEFNRWAIYMLDFIAKNE